MTPDARKALSAAIRGLRERLADELHAAMTTEYRLSLDLDEARLSEAAAARRRRLEGWILEQLRSEAERALEAKRKPGWSEERVQAERTKLVEAQARSGVRERLWGEVAKRAAYTLLNRLVIVRTLEALRIRPDAPPVVTGGWQSRGYQDFRAVAPALHRGDASEGYAFLLQLVFEDLATELPGLFGPAGVADLVPVPPGTLRHVVEALDAEALGPCWTDDLLLGWVYQYWNDPDREALDAKLNGGGKVEPHEIASKTQMFTERYMVDWLLQNSLGPMWLAMCRKHGWTPEAERDGTLAALEARRVAWRGARDRGEVSLTDLMPLETDVERQWAYYVPQPIPDDAVAQAPDSVRDLKVLDPAVGSGHFLVVAFDLLVALYREEARHRGEAGEDRWSDLAIVERILSHNLHGIDLDPRAVQIAAAALWLKARRASAEARPARMNLVASDLRLAGLPDDDPALVELRRAVEAETGIPGALTDRIVHALRGADHLGSLLRVDAAVDAAIQEHEAGLSRRVDEQGALFGGFAARAPRVTIGRDEARTTVLGQLDAFLARHTGGDDLGLRLRGEQLAAGVRFVRLVREGQYDLVVGNPPYQGTAKLADAAYVQAEYPRGKADLYAAFLERGLQLVRAGGVSALLTMRNWMFIKQYAELRKWLLETWDLRALGDFDRGAFEEVPDEVVSVVVSVFRRAAPAGVESVALQPTALDDRSRDGERTGRKRAAVLAGVGSRLFQPTSLVNIADVPLVYWWQQKRLQEYTSAQMLGNQSPIKVGLASSGGTRFSRFVWEVLEFHWDRFRIAPDESYHGVTTGLTWSPIVRGAKGKAWFEPLETIVAWRRNGLEVKLSFEDAPGGRVVGETWYHTPGISYPKISQSFAARAHRYRSIFGDAACTVFPHDIPNTLCLMNSGVVKSILQDLNPSVNFQVGDVERIPLLTVQSARAVWDKLNAAFTDHEVRRESSVEFCRPGPSPWSHVQDWAQDAVDRPEGAPLPPYEPDLDPEPPTDYLSYALGVALGRFGSDGAGILDPATADLSHALPAGILFLDGTLEPADLRDGLGHESAAPIHAAWSEHGPTIDTKRTSLRDWLRLDFFGQVHRPMYENRPIHWPLSSADKTFVAWVNIHRWTADTLTTLLADHLVPARTRLEGELADLRAARDGADTKAARAAERRLAKVQAAYDELLQFMVDVQQCAERGPPPTDPNTKKCPPRERDVRYVPDHDDGVMINSAALWPLLEPQWKEPKKWWTELALADGRKDYDWSHLAMRYWPSRVDAKCQQDPSLGVAHGCFWRYHPARAWAWELRLQQEIAPDFRIEEGPYTHPDGTVSKDHGPLRAAYLCDHAEEALGAVEAEALRRIGRGDKRTVVSEMTLLEAGLWSDWPALCSELELRVAQKQEGAPFFLRSPDAPKRSNEGVVLGSTKSHMGGSQ